MLQRASALTVAIFREFVSVAFASYVSTYMVVILHMIKIIITLKIKFYNSYNQYLSLKYN